jgi:GGDEF domain-containing protein
VFFHRSRAVVALLGLAFVEAAIPPTPGELDPLLPLGTILLALLGVLALLRDHGLRSRGGAAQLILGAALAYGAYLVFGGPVRLRAFSSVQLLPTGMLEGAEMPQATLVVGAVSLLAAAYGTHRWRGPVERALLWTQVIVLIAMVPALGPAESGILLMAGGLVVSLSVLEQSYSMAYRDELTGLPGRRALMHDLAELNGKYAVAMVDVDHFKNFNDKHGHDVGDQVLLLVATRLAAGPGGGKAYRYGGEEFTLLYPGRTRDDALPHADAVRAAVERATFSLRAWNRPRKKPDQAGGKKKAKKGKRPRKLSVTVSMGLADSTGSDSSAEAVLRLADEALYRAKGDGRNRVAQ